MKSELGVFIAGLAVVASGCSIDKTPTTPVPTIPIDNLINCQVNPLDSKGKIFPVESGKIIRVGAITKSGKEDVVAFKADGDGSFEYNPENNDFIGPLPQPGQLETEDKNMLVVAVAALGNNKVTQMGISMTCIDAVPSIIPGFGPNASQIPQT